MAEKIGVKDLPGVGAATAEKLKEAGYETLLSIAVASPAELVEAAGMGEAVARKIIYNARQKLDMGFETGEELMKKRENIIKLTTGSKALDGLFGGGVESNAVTEVYGEFGSGKTGLAHQLAVNVQLPKEKGGADGMTVWLDSESSLPYDEKILIEQNDILRLVNIGELVENALNNTESITRFGETISTADNQDDIKAVSYDPDDYKIKTFSITGFVKHPKKKIYEVKLLSGRKVRVTEYHNFFSLNKDCQLSEIATKNLKIGSKIAVAASIPIKMGINILDNSKLFGDRNDLFVRGGDQFKSFLKRISKKLRGFSSELEKSYSSTDNWISRSELPLNVYNKLRDEISDDIKKTLRIGGWSRKSAIPMLMPITKDLMRFLGLYVAEGSCLKGKSVVITCTQEYVEDYVRYFANGLGLNALRTKSDLKINSKPFALFIEKLNMGYTADTKKLSDFMLSLDKEHISAFIEGYVVGDGSEDMLTGSTTCETKSHELATGLLYSTCALNIPARHNTVNRTYKASDKNGIRPENDGMEYTMQSISWQTALLRDSRLDELPNSELQFSSILSEAIKNNYHKTKKFLKLIDMNYSYLVNMLKNGSKSIRKSTLKKMLEHLPESEDILKIKKIVDSDIWFDSVESIKEVGEEIVYDIEVMPNNKEVQNFIGGHGGIILHNTFRPERITQIAKAAGLDPVQALKNIKIARCFNSDHQMLLAERVEDLLGKEAMPIKLLIVDSLMSHFRADFSGRGQLADRQQKLNKHMHTLLKLANNYGLVVYITNQVMAKPDVFFGDPTAAVGGHVLHHASTYRVYLRKGKKGTRVAKMVDAPHLGENEAIFIVTENGIRDV